MLEIKKMGHAFLMATIDNQSILFDPWFGQPLNYNTFYPFPEMTALTPDEKSNVIAIHISHIHDDHLQEDTLKSFKTTTPILISKYIDTKMKDKISNLGFEKIIEIEGGYQGFNIGPFGITTFPKIINDGSYDSSVVLTVDRKNYYISNDCIHYDGFYKILNLMFPHFEGAFIGHTSISPFSWCVDVSACEQFTIKLSHENVLKDRQKNVWNHIETVSKYISPRWVVPYSSDFYFVHTEMIHFDRYFEKANEILNYDLKSAKPLILENGDSIRTEEDLFQIIQSKQKRSMEPQFLGSWINENCENIDFSKFIQLAEQYFFKFFQEKSKTWANPMKILISFYENDLKKDIFYFASNGYVEIKKDDSIYDLKISYPARAFNGVIQKRWSLRQFHYFFLFRAKWRTYKHGQMDMSSW
jgi:hypothetical protein